MGHLIKKRNTIKSIKATMKNYNNKSRLFISLGLGTVISVSILLFSFTNKKRARVLVFSKTTGYFHESIPVGNSAIVKLGKENGFDVDTTKDSKVFNEDNLEKYAAIVFLSTTEGKEDLLDEKQKKAFVQYIHDGGGWVGIHAATDAGYRWPWYTKLSGALFLSHPAQQNASIKVEDRTHPSTLYLPQTWVRFDEWYNFKNIDKNLNVVLSIDEKSYSGGVNGNNHPMAWYHSFEGGRSFYTELGHTDASYSDPMYLKHVLGGIRYAMDQNETSRGNSN